MLEIPSKPNGILLFSRSPKTHPKNLMFSKLFSMIFGFLIQKALDLAYEIQGFLEPFSGVGNTK